MNKSENVSMNKRTNSSRAQDAESEDSFRATTTRKKATKIAWAGGKAVDQDNFLRMQQDYLAMKKEQVDMENKLRVMGAQLQRAEEAAKRALVMQHEVDQAGNLMPKPQAKRLVVADRIIGLEMEVSRLEASNRDLQAKLLRKQKEAADWKGKAAAAKSRSDEALRDVRQNNLKIARLEQAARTRSLSSTLGPEEARQFARNHDALIDEINDLKDKNSVLQQELEQRRMDEPDEDTVVRLKRERDEALAELEQLRASPNTPGGGGPAGNPLEEWVLEMVEDERGTRCLRDASEMMLFTDGTQERWPRPLGPISKDGRHESGRIEKFLMSVTNMLQRGQKGSLREVFDKYVTPDGKSHGEAGGSLDRTGVEAMLRDLYGQVHGPAGKENGAQPLSAGDVDFVIRLLDVNGDGLISFDEFQSSIKDSLLARQDANNSRSLEVVGLSGRLLAAVQDNMGSLQRFFQEHAVKTPHSRPDNPAVDLHEAAAMLSSPPFCPNLKEREKRLLLLMLLDWDFKSEGCIYLVNLLRMVHAVKLVKIAPGQGQRPVGPWSPGGPAAASHHPDDQRRIEALQMENARWRSELEDAQRQLAQWESILANTGGQRLPIMTGNPEVDARIRELHESDERYKAAYLKTKSTLEHSLKPFEEQQRLLMETQARLVDITRQYNAAQERADRCGKAEAACERMQKEFMNLTKERDELLDQQLRGTSTMRSTLREKDGKIRALEESLRNAVEREAKAERMLADVKTDRSKSAVHNLQLQLARAEERGDMLTNEIERLRERMKLYMGATGGRDAARGNGEGAALGPGFDVNDLEIMRIHLEQDQAELAKYKQLYKSSEEMLESVRAMNGELESRLGTVERANQAKIDQLHRQVDKLQDELDKLRRLPAAAPFPSGPADVLPDDLSDVGENQNVFELVVESARFEDHMESDVSTFFTMDFYDHPTQLSTRQTGRSPKYDTIVQFIVPMDFNFLSYLATSVLQLELNQIHGFDFTAIGRAQLLLSQVKRDLEVTPNAPTRRQLEIRGAADRLLGKVTVTFRTLRPLLPFVRKFQERLARQVPQHPDVFVTFAANAARQPSRASGIRVTVQACHDLVTPRGAEARPYVSYEFPGYPAPVDSPFGSGASPEFKDSHVFEFGDAPQTSQEFARALQACAVLVVVFDGAGEGADAQIGTANISLKGLTGDSRMVAGRFTLEHPATKAPTGTVDVVIEWTDLLGRPQPGVPPAVLQKLIAGQKPLQPLSAQVAPGENVVEVTLVDAQLQDGVLAQGQQVHASFGFYTFQRASSPSIASLTPSFKYSVEYKVAVNNEFLNYMDNCSFSIGFFKLAGWEATQFGSASIPLRDVVNAFADGHGVGQSAATFNAHIISDETSQMLGQCKVAFRCLNPVKDALDAFRSRPAGIQASSKASPPNSAARERSPAAAAAARSSSPTLQPSAASQRYSALSESIDTPLSNAELAVKVPSNPTAWPADLDNSIVICIESVQLMAPLLNKKAHKAYAVFWSLLDAMVDDALESTRFVDKTSALLSFSEATAYRLRGVTAEQRQAQGRLVELLQNNNDLAFALAAPAGPNLEGVELVGETDPIRVWDIMEIDEHRWRSNRVPFFDPGTRQHVADLVVTIVAQRALRALWEGA